MRLAHRQQSAMRWQCKHPRCPLYASISQHHSMPTFSPRPCEHLCRDSTSPRRGAISLHYPKAGLVDGCFGSCHGINSSVDIFFGCVFGRLARCGLSLPSSRNAVLTLQGGYCSRIAAGAACGDSTWPGACCLNEGYICLRFSESYWECR